jgi:hypothetical protein
MKNINDTKIYLSVIIAPLVIALIIGSISLYSKLVVEKKARSLIASESTLKEGYLLLREPQLFGGYKYWDSDGMAVKNSLRYFDSKIANGGEIKPDEKIYLQLILNRRVSGSELGIKSSLFLIIISFTGFIAYIIERKRVKNI